MAFQDGTDSTPTQTNYTRLDCRQAEAPFTHCLMGLRPSVTIAPFWEASLGRKGANPPTPSFPFSIQALPSFLFWRKFLFRHEPTNFLPLGTGWLASSFYVRIQGISSSL